MTEAEAIALILKHVKGLFPRSCSSCHRTFPTLHDYLKSTEPMGRPLSSDLEAGSLDVLRPVGAVAFSKCACGATLGVTPAGIPLPVLWQLLLWAKSESDRRGMKPREFLEYVRWEVRRCALAEPAESAKPAGP